MKQSETYNYWIRPCTLVWVVLLMLTFLTWLIGQLGLSGPTVAGFILLTTLIKGQMVADFFMGLKQVRLLWRMIVFLYLLIVASLIGLAYLISLN